MADFQSYKYETDPGVIMLCRLDVESKAFAGTEPAAGIDIDASVVQSQSRRAFGVKPRFANLSREVGTAPNTFNKYKRVPLLTPARASAVTALIGTTVAIGGNDWTIRGVSGEERN